MNLTENIFFIFFYSGFVVPFLCGLLVILADHKRRSNKLWFFLSLMSAIWSLGWVFLISSDTEQLAMYSNWVIHGAAIWISPIFLHFCLSFTNTIRIYSLKIFLIFTYCSAFLLFIINFSSALVYVEGPKYMFSFVPKMGPLFTLFILHFWINVIVSEILLIRSWIISKGFTKKQLSFFVPATLFGFLGGGTAFLYTVGIDFPPYGILIFCFYPIVVTYAILRYGLFSLRIGTSQIFVISLWVLMFGRVIFDFSLESLLIDLVLLSLAITVGSILMKSIQKEIYQREQIEKLAKNLETANKHQEDLLHFITHQVKGFLTKNRIIFAELKEGGYGELPEQAREVSAMGLDISTEAVKMVHNVLQAGDLKTGQVEYIKKEINMGELVREVAEEMRSDAEKKGLNYELNIEGSEHVINGDWEKIKHVVHNLIDNAVRYTQEGEVKVSLRSGDGKLIFAVEDTGVGLTEEDKKKLFTEGGKGQRSSEINPESTGHGLYIIKQIVQAHDGQVWAESEGEGQGSKFIVEIPAG